MNGTLDVMFVAQVFGPLRQIDTGFAKHTPAPGLGAVIRQLGVEPVERNPQQHRQLALQRRGVENGEVRLVAIRNRRANALDQAGTLDDLLRQGSRRRVVTAEHRHPGQRV